MLVPCDSNHSCILTYQQQSSPCSVSCFDDISVNLEYLHLGNSHNFWIPVTDWNNASVIIGTADYIMGHWWFVSQFSFRERLTSFKRSNGPIRPNNRLQLKICFIFENNQQTRYCLVSQNSNQNKCTVANKWIKIKLVKASCYYTCKILKSNRL